MRPPIVDPFEDPKATYDYALQHQLRKERLSRLMKDYLRRRHQAAQYMGKPSLRVVDPPREP